MTILNEGNETSAWQKAKENKQKISNYMSKQNKDSLDLNEISNWVLNKHKPEKYMVIMFKNKKEFGRYSFATLQKIDNFKEVQTLRFEKDSITFSKIYEI